jgi:hypothetical protein
MTAARLYVAEFAAVTASSSSPTAITERPDISPKMIGSGCSFYRSRTRRTGRRHLGASTQSAAVF